MKKESKQKKSASCKTGTLNSWVKRYEKSFEVKENTSEQLSLNHNEKHAQIPSNLSPELDQSKVNEISLKTAEVEQQITNERSLLKDISDKIPNEEVQLSKVSAIDQNQVVENKILQDETMPSDLLKFSKKQKLNKAEIVNGSNTKISSSIKKNELGNNKAKNITQKKQNVPIYQQTSSSLSHSSTEDQNDDMTILRHKRRRIARQTIINYSDTSDTENSYSLEKDCKLPVQIENNATSLEFETTTPQLMQNNDINENGLEMNMIHQKKEKTQSKQQKKTPKIKNDDTKLSNIKEENDNEMCYTTPTMDVQQSMQGLKIVLTGVFDSCTREEMIDHIKRNGGSCTTAVSGRTDFLVTGSILEDQRPIEQGKKISESKPATTRF